MKTSIKKIHHQKMKKMTQKSKFYLVEKSFFHLALQIILACFISYYVVIYHIRSLYIILGHVISYKDYVISYKVMLYHIRSLYTILGHFIS